MPEKKLPVDQAQKVKFVRELQRTQAIDFDKIGELVKQLPDNMLGSGTVAADHVIKVAESVLHITELKSEQLKLDEVAKLRDLATRVERPGL